MNRQECSEGTIERAGGRLAYYSAGTGAPVLFIQGVGVQGNGWLPQVQVMAQHQRCVWFDNRGMGGSSWDGRAFTVRELAEDALAVMDTLGIGAAHVVGHSLGGLLAQELALCARERVRSLSLLCSFASGRDATRLTPAMLWLGLRTRVGTRRQRRAAFLRLVMPERLLASADREELAAQLAELFGHDLADQPAVAMKQLAAMRVHDVGPRLSELAGLPTLVLSAEHDPIARPEFGRAIASRLPGATYLELGGASHGAPISQASDVNELLLQHIARAERRYSLLSAQL